MKKDSLIAFGLLMSLTVWIAGGRYAQASIDTAYYNKYTAYIEKVDRKLDNYAKKRYEKELAKVREQNRIAHEQMLAYQKAKALAAKKEEERQQRIAIKVSQQQAATRRQKAAQQKLQEEAVVQQRQRIADDKALQQEAAQASLAQARANAQRAIQMRQMQRRSRRSMAS